MGANHVGESVVILVVAYAYGKWWSVPLETSGEVFAQCKEGLLGQCSWDSEIYAIHFNIMVQTNVSTGSERWIRFVIWFKSLPTSQGGRCGRFPNCA